MYVQMRAGNGSTEDLPERLLGSTKQNVQFKFQKKIRNESSFQLKG